MSKYIQYREEILDLLDTHSNNAIAKHLIAEHGLNAGANRSIRGLAAELRRSLENSAIEEFARLKGIPREKVSGYWYKGSYNDDSMSVRVSESKEEITEEDIRTAVENALDGISLSIKDDGNKPNDKALKVVLSDIHIGLDPNPQGNSIFPYEYNEEIFRNNLSKVFDKVIKDYEANGKFDLFILDDLGDGLDGYNGYTTRGGHQLDQNLSNLQAFEAYVKGKYSLIKSIIEKNLADKYIIRSVGNCNHAGDFGQIANKSIEFMFECLGADKIKFHVLEKFMDHFEYGDHTFILTHGKDQKYMKRGLPLKLDDRTINYISDYIDLHEIKSKHIHLEKGDLHQIGYERCRKFDYRNYMSFAPPSAWVQHNFGNAYSGFSVQIVPKYSGEIQHTDIILEQVKAKK